MTYEIIVTKMVGGVIIRRRLPVLQRTATGWGRCDGMLTRGIRDMVVKGVQMYGTGGQYFILFISF